MKCAEEFTSPHAHVAHDRSWAAAAHKATAVPRAVLPAATAVFLSTVTTMAVLAVTASGSSWFSRKTEITQSAGAWGRVV